MSRTRSKNGYLFNVLLAIFAVVGAIVFMWEISHSAERDWRAFYQNRYGEDCCDDDDCSEIRTDVALRLRIGEFALVGEYVHAPVNVIYPTQDGRSWFCTTGCLFRPLLN